MHLRKRIDATTFPSPKTVTASGKFEGNDGKWSTFFINLNSDKEGVNGQDFRVLASTSSPITLVPAQTEWCNETCAETRGVLLFDGKQPKGMEPTGSWVKAGLYTIPTPYWYSKDLMNGNIPPNGTWGSTNVGLGQSSKGSMVVADRYAVSYIFQEYFLGSFGLSAGAVGGPGATKSTFLSQFRLDNIIASTSYAYTAGAWYRNNKNGVPGSLVLGGYDNARMANQGLSIQMPNTQNNTLMAGVPSILYSSAPDIATNDMSLTKDCGGFRANIDSTLPYLILPDCICDQLQDIFGLTYDEAQNLYFVNTSSHESNKQQRGTVEFKIAETSSDSAKFTNIQLPYSAFDHQISSAKGENATNYFPIKKSRTGMFTLGRTFLQEAYIIVDYDRLNFTVAPARYANDDSMPKEDLKIIFNQTFTPATVSTHADSGLAPGAIAGAVVGIVVAFAIAGIIAFCWWKKRKSKKQVAAPQPYETSQIDPSLAGQEIKYRRVSELTGSDLPSSPKTPITGYYSVDHKSVPPISEMSPESPPAELYSPPPESASDADGRDYFTAGKPHRRGAQRDRASSGYTTPGTPIAELPGDEGQFHTPGTHFEAVSPLTSPANVRGPSDTSLSTNIDERLADHKRGTTKPADAAQTATADEAVDSKTEAQAGATTEPERERRPSHQRGLSDTTVASDSTAVSQPTPEEQERWAREPRRPLSE